MKSRTVILLWIIAIVLGVTAFAVKFGRDDDQATRTKLAPGEKIIAKLPIPEVTKVTLSRGKEMTTLVRSASDDQLWGVIERQNYPVNYELLRNLLGALSELEVAQGYPVNETASCTLRLSAKAARYRRTRATTRTRASWSPSSAKDESLIENHLPWQIFRHQRERRPFPSSRQRRGWCLCRGRNFPRCYCVSPGLA